MKWRLLRMPKEEVRTNDEAQWIDGLTADGAPWNFEAPEDEGLQQSTSTS